MLTNRPVGPLLLGLALCSVPVWQSPRLCAEDSAAQESAHAQAFWDGARVGAGRSAAVLAGQNGLAEPATVRGVAVSKKSLRQANDEVLALREQVWQGRLPAADFYGRVKAVYERRFGPGYAAQVQSFLDAQAKRAHRPGQTVAFDLMTPEDRAAFFLAMPKGSELHLHLTGAIPPETILDIGEQLGTDLPVANVKRILRAQDLSAYGVDSAKTTIKVGEMSPQLRAAVAEAMVSHQGEDFVAFLDKWAIIGPITRDPRSYYPMMQAMADYARKQNIVYLELLVSAEVAQLQAAADAAARVQKETGVTIRLIASSSWGVKPEFIDEGLAKADALYDQGVVGYNMVANEKISGLPYLGSFQKMREKMSRLSVSLHAGEQSGTAGNLVNDLLLGPKRYGHATHVEEDPLAEAVLYENKIPVEVSLYSNQNTHVLDDLARHPEPKFLGWKVPVIPSTDDPGVFKSTLSQEYEHGQKQFDLSWKELKEMSRNGIRYSFADAQTKARLMKDLNSRLKRFEKSPLFKEYKKEEQAAAAPTPPQPVFLKLR